MVSDNGAHLAAALNRLKDMEGPDGSVVARVSSRLAELVPVVSVDVVRDDVRELLTLSVTEAGGQKFAANAISDGTLRFLALSVLAEDPEAKGLICIEEPENGIHPERLPAMAELIRDLAVDVNDPIDSGNIMRQVILATHSPYFLQLQSPNDVLIAQETLMRCGDSSMRGLRCYSLEGSWRAAVGSGNSVLGISMMQDYLQPPEGVQLRLPL
ncbi:MAG: ATP-binding protein [Gammaproteobacteria bacterium]|nr:ATP-binding protein [Gammaproteobacteria bacterium]